MRRRTTASWLLGACVVAALVLMVIASVRSFRAARAERAERAEFRTRARSYAVGPDSDRRTAVRVDFSVPKTTEGRASVRGRVVDATGAGVKGARIGLFQPAAFRTTSVGDLSADGRATLSGEDGHFTLWPSGEAQEWELVARHRGYRHARLRFSTPHADTLLVRLSEGLSIAGRVVTVESATPVPAVRLVARGIGAAAQSGRSDLMAPPHAHVQHCETDPAGRFEFRGLAEQEYQLEIVESGLVTAPTGFRVVEHPNGKIRTFGAIAGRSSVFDRAVHARAGQHDVTILVAPVAVARFRCEDAVSGLAIAAFNYRTDPIPEFEAWPNIPLPGYADFVAAGDIHGNHWTYQPTAHRSQVWLSFRWPIDSSASSRTTVAARGFRRATVDVPLRAVGQSNPPTIIRLQPEGPRGGLRIVLRDQGGRSIGPMTKFLFALRPGEVLERGKTLSFPVQFQEDGATDAVSFPAGEFELHSRGAASKTEYFRPKRFTVREAESTTVEVQLIGTAATVSFVDERGRTLDDVGYRFARVPDAAEVTAEETAGRMRMTGFLLRPPGLGAMPAQAHVAWAPGTWYVLAYRHGYADLALPVELHEGRFARIVAKMTEAPGSPWARAYRR